MARARTTDFDVIAREGYPFIVIAFLLMVVGDFFYRPTLLFLAPFFIFVISFFRNPKRVVPAREDALICSADGRILDVRTVKESRYLNEEVTRVSIFMSPFNVHVNRIPLSGEVLLADYKPGKFLGAYDERASDDNEQNIVVLQTKDQQKIMFVQIAGFLARRIVCYARAGESWKKGEIFGLIRFGSRMDLYFSKEWAVSVKAGDRVVAGESIIAVKS